MSKRTAVIAILAALVVYAAIVVRNFSGPIGDHVESFLYEYLSYYVSKNLSFSPLPHLDLDNDQAFYPFGTNVALQSFCVERDLLFTLLARLFGRGPWLQIYYVAGLAIAAYGTWALLRRQHGDTRAALVAIGANFLNFYGAQKYPYHFNMACVHWTTLSIVTDFVIAERLVLRQRVSLSLILLRVLLVVLSFGLELGHVVGYGLTSLLALCVFTVVLLVVRRREPESDLRRFAAGLRDELRARKGALGALAAAIVVFGVLYGSIVGQLVVASRKYDFSGVPLGVWWSHPVRLFIPYFPWIHPSQQPRFLRVFGDQAEVGIGSGGAGWVLLAAAAMGFVQAKKKARFVPLLVVFFAYVVSRPGFDLVRWMPWFAFTRVFSRATVVYSTILSLLAIEISFRALPHRARRPVMGTFAVVGALELVTFGRIKMSHPAFAFDDRFLAHMKKIESLPGEAVLDFPFCILGGNGDLHYLCPYMEKLKSVYALQRFHHKKVIGQYLGRVHPSQTQPFADQGWPKVWDPDDPDPIEADHQIRCLNDREWTFFTAFYEKNDFAGIQLAVDRLPPGCAEEFYRRFGAPMGEVSIPRAGRLAFIARDPSTRDRLDREGGKKVRLVVELDEHPAEIVRRLVPVALDTTGFSGFEWIGKPKNPEGMWRWALAPASEISFEIYGSRVLHMSARFRTPLRGQRVAVTLDGRLLDTWSDLPPDTSVERSLEAPVGTGKHVVRLTYSLANAEPPRGVVFAPDDPRPMTVMFESLVLRADPAED